MSTTPDSLDLDQLAGAARRGTLSGSDVNRLKALSTDHGDYTRANVLLYEDAKARGDTGARMAYLSRLMTQPENRYNPALLVEEAELAIRNKNYQLALDKANLAERHWARLPSDLIFSRKVMIYEIQARSHEGLFISSGGDNPEQISSAIRGWERYRRHAETESRSDLIRKADAQIAKLQDVQKRVGGR